MSTPVISPYIPSYGPVPNITPFTYRDGLSYLARLERIVKYINRDLVVFINTSFAELAGSIDTDVNELINEVNAALAAQTALVEAAVADVVGNSITVQDPVVAALLNNGSSQTRIAANALYAAKSYETIVTALNTLITTGRLSVETLDARFLAKADQTALDSLITTVGNKADKSTQTTVESGRLSAASVDARIIDAKMQAIRNKFTGKQISPLFDFLRAGIVTPTQDTRVVILGSSNANSWRATTNWLTEKYKAATSRLAYRASSAEQFDLDAVASPVSAAGIKFWSGAEGNTTSANYFPVARRTALSNVSPRYVITFIGENDLFYGTSIASYKANVKSAVEFTEGVNPSVINVLVHNPGRNDVSSPVAPWSDYGNALKEIADEKPLQRYFIDLNEHFGVLGIMNNDNADMIWDGVHWNDMGSILVADIVGAHLGIPSETDFAKNEQTYQMPLPNTDTTYSTAGATVAELYFNPVKYAREVELFGSLWQNLSNAGGYYTLAVLDAASATVDSIGVTPGATGVRSQVIATRLKIPPMVGGRVVLLAWPATGTAVVTGASTALSRIRAAFKRV